jgi:hypothetical protein
MTIVLTIKATRHRTAQTLTNGLVKNEARINAGYTHTITGTVIGVESDNPKHQAAMNNTAIVYMNETQLSSIQRQAAELFNQFNTGLEVQFQVEITKLGKPQATQYEGRTRVQFHVYPQLSYTYVVEEAEEDWDDMDVELLEVGQSLSDYHTKAAKASNVGRTSGLMAFLNKAREVLTTPIGMAPEEITPPSPNKTRSGGGRRTTGR